MTSISTETKQFRAACENYEFAESIGDIKYHNEVAYEAYQKAFNMAIGTMQDIADNSGATFGQVLEAVREALKA